MCGLAGIVGPDARQYRPAVERMVEAVSHRGPDGTGLFTSPSGRCVLGHRRLAILDLTEEAAQPMATPNGRFTMVYNGEAYNFVELREQLAKEGIEIKTSGGHKITLDDNARKTTIQSSGDVEIKAGMNLKIEAGAMMDLKASGPVNIKGAIVNIN